MNTRSLMRAGAHSSWAIVLVVAMLAALLAVIVLAKPSQAQGAQITVNPTTVGFGAVEVNASTDPTRPILVTNTGSTDVTIGGASTAITGPNAGDFNLLPQVIDAVSGLPLPGDLLTTGVTVGAGDTVELQVSFDASAAGTRDAVLGLTDTVGNALQSVNLTGTGTPTDPAGQPGVQSNCTIFGTPKGEVLTGTSGHDVICALGGNDKVNGLRANDVERGGSGKDRITDHAGKDKLYGQGGRDTLNARDHHRGDVLKGGAGKDRAIKDKRDRARSI